MYRQLGHDGIVFGLRKGPYTGLPRTFTFGELPPAVLDRLRLAMTGKGRPEPLLRREGGLVALPLLLPGLFSAAALAAMGLLASWKFGQASGLYQGPELALTYALGTAVLVLSARLAWRTRKGTLPRRGVYLFPLDLIEVGASSVTVVPLGGVRDVTVEGDHGAPVLVLSFEHGARHTFPVKDEREAELAYRHIEHAQRTIESLTNRTDLELALDVDPFFILRGAGASGQPARLWQSAPRSTRQLAFGWARAALAGAALGGLFWSARNVYSDEALFSSATNANTEEAFREYLSVGRRRRDDASRALGLLESLTFLRAENQRISEAREKRAEQEQRWLDEQARRIAEARTDSCAQPVAERTREQALACFRRQARKAADKPDVAAMVRDLTRTKATLDVRFLRGGVPAEASLLAASETRLAEVFGLVLSEIFPASVLRVETSPKGPADLVIKYRIDRAKLEEATFSFDVLFTRGHEQTGFTLTMPPPREPLSSTRPQSLYTIDRQSLTPAPTQAAAARAFDRLYDEVYGLFLDGNPRVPRQPDAVAAASPRP